MPSLEAMSEEKQRGGALPHLEGLSLCEVGWVLKSHLWKRFGHAGNVEGVQHLLAGERIP